MGPVIFGNLFKKSGTVIGLSVDPLNPNLARKWCEGISIGSDAVSRSVRTAGEGVDSAIGDFVPHSPRIVGVDAAPPLLARP
jgi:hypothetical protein